MERLGRELAARIGDRPTVFACIGSDRSTGDALGPLAGDRLTLAGAEVVGTLSSPLHALNLEERIGAIQSRPARPLIVALDAALGPRERVGRIALNDQGLDPGRALGKSLDAVGDLSITVTVNVATRAERQRTLQSTRLFFVMNAADLVARSCERALRIQRAEHPLPLR